ncbi:oligosaccharide flippase family protein [Candidatus Woesearchaeota archaeon]|nr:oligosaccharide flippase family protein [Candidatus Woesearchaeota archaeon]
MKHFKRIYHKNKANTKNFFWRSLQIFGKQLITFLTFLITTKFLEPEQFGLYTYLTAVAYLLTLFGDFGISQATSKYVAETEAKDTKGAKQILFSSTVAVGALISLITLTLLIFGKMIFKENYGFILFYIPYLFFLPISSVLDGIYRGQKRFKELSIIATVAGIITVASAYFLIMKFSILGAIAAQNIFFILLAVFLFIRMRKEIEWKINKDLLRQILTYSIILGLSSFAFFMYSRADIIILKQFGFLKEIGYYEVLVRLFDFIILPAVIFGQIIAPNTTRLHTLKKHHDVKKNMLEETGIVLIIATIISVAAYFIIPEIISSFFTKYFTVETRLMFGLLIFVVPFRFASTFLSQAHFIPTGKAKEMLKIMVIAGFLNISLDILFIWRFGFMGVIYSTLICATYTAIASYIVYFRLLHKEMTVQ